MTLHARESVRSSLDDSVYSSKDMAKAAPKYRFPDEEWRAEDAYAVVADELMLDGNSRQNLATFCQTWEEPEVHRLMDLAIDKNMIDKDEYPQTAEIERRCVHMLADLWNAPESANTVGASAIGSSEACMLGGMAAKWRWRAKRAAAGQPPIGRTWCAGRCRSCGTSSPSTGTSRCARCRCRPGTTRWTSTTCWPASTRTRSWSCRRSASRTPAPTSWSSRWPPRSTRCRPRPGWTSTSTSTAPAARSWRRSARPTSCGTSACPRVKSISTSGHKFGLAPLGVGWVVWRDVAELPDDLIFHVSYLGGDMPVFQINFSRPAGQIAAQYYDFVRLGREGYRRVHMASYDTGRFLAERDRQAGTVRADLRQRPADRHPGRGVEAGRRRRPRLHALRPRRPAAHPRLAGAGLPADRGGGGRRRAAHPGPPRCQPRPRGDPARRHAQRRRATSPSTRSRCR